MPIQKNDIHSTQISQNIFRLTSAMPILFNLHETFGSFNQPALLRFFDEHRKLGLDVIPFIFGFLVHAAVMLDGAELYNPDGGDYLTSMNLFVQLIGEPGNLSFLYLCLIDCFLGSNKSGLLRAFGSTMSVLSRLFPTFFSKPVTEVTNGKEKTTMVGLIVNNDTELSLFQKLSRRVSFTINIVFEKHNATSI